MLLGGVFSGLSFATNDVLLPAGTIEFNRIYRRILYSNPGLELEPNTVKHFEDSSIVTGDVSGDVLSDVTIIDRDDSGRQRVITAAHVRLRESGQQAGVISLQLSNVFTHLIGADPGDFEYIRAAAMEYHIVLRRSSRPWCRSGRRSRVRRTCGRQFPCSGRNEHSANCRTRPSPLMPCCSISGPWPHGWRTRRRPRAAHCSAVSGSGSPLSTID